MPAPKAKIDRVFHALGDPTRRALLEKLGAGPVSVSKLAEPLGLTVAAIVQHLQVLEDAELVQTEKVGRVRSCRVNPRGLEVAVQWIDARRPGWDKAFDRLSQLLTK